MVLFFNFLLTFSRHSLWISCSISPSGFHFQNRFILGALPQVLVFKPFKLFTALNELLIILGALPQVVVSEHFRLFTALNELLIILGALPQVVVSEPFRLLVTITELLIIYHLSHFSLG